MTLAPEELVSRDSEVLNDELVFTGTRVPVRIVLDDLRSGSTRHNSS